VHIVAIYRAKVNDWEPVDAFGKVENLGTLVVGFYFEWKKWKKKEKSRRCL
jgi:hypothetical protein